MSYKIGISTGWWSIAKSDELLGLAKKLSTVTTYGVTYAQVDFESIAEFREPMVVQQMKRIIDSLGIKWGAHGEIGEYMAWESALEIIWKQSHRRLHQYLDAIYENFIKSGYEKYKPEYINFHSSNTPSIGMFVERYRYTGHLTVDFTGNLDWDKFLKTDVDKDPAKKALFEWFKHNLLYLIIGREAGIAFVTVDDIKYHIARYAVEKEIKEGILKPKDETDTRSRIKELLENEEELLEHGYQMWLELTKLRFAKGSITQEEIAYVIVARYLYEKRNDPSEPLWKLFFGDKTWEDLEKEWSTPTKTVKIVDLERGVVNLMPELVALVASRYIIGHFQQPNLPEFIEEKKRSFYLEKLDDFYYKTAFEKLAVIKVYFTFENPEILEGQREGLQRLIHAVDIYRLVKAAEMIGGEGGKYFGIIFDQEHYLHNNLDPIKEIEACPDDLGKYLIGFHVGAPKPYHPAHEPIDLASDAQYWIYVYAWHLRKKGFGVLREGILIFERGGARGRLPAQFIGESAIALKRIAEYLEKDIPPEKLPPEFYGISTDEILSEERQLAIIKEHALDPLKGLLHVPEEHYGFFSRRAIERGKKPEEWKKEELR